MRVTVIGAGVAGLTSALAWPSAAARSRSSIAAASLGAASCSRYAGGMLAPWCERESAEELVVELGREALDYWPAHHPGTVRRGSLVLALRRDEPDLDRFARRTTATSDWMPTAIAALEPDLAGRFARACSSPMRPISTRAPPWLRSRADLERRGVPIRFGVEAGGRARPGRRLPRPRRPRPPARPARRQGRDAASPLPRRLAAPPGAAAASALPALHRAARRPSLHDRRHHDRERRARPGHRPLRGRAAQRRLCASPGLCRGRDRRARLRRPPGLPRQPAAHPPAGRHASTSTASTATAFCSRRPWRAGPPPCCWTGPTSRR